MAGQWYYSEVIVDLESDRAGRVVLVNRDTDAEARIDRDAFEALYQQQQMPSDSKNQE